MCTRVRAASRTLDYSSIEWTLIIFEGHNFRGSRFQLAAPTSRLSHVFFVVAIGWVQQHCILLLVSRLQLSALG